MLFFLQIPKESTGRRGRYGRQESSGSTTGTTIPTTPQTTTLRHGAWHGLLLSTGLWLPPKKTLKESYMIPLYFVIYGLFIFNLFVFVAIGYLCFTNVPRPVQASSVRFLGIRNEMNMFGQFPELQGQVCPCRDASFGICCVVITHLNIVPYNVHLGYLLGQRWRNLLVNLIEFCQCKLFSILNI